MKLITSNANKIKEYQSFGLNIDIQPGVDLPEVLGNMDEVVIHKSKLAGKGLVVEDTILEIDGEEVVDIRWKINSLNDKSNIPSRWIVSLGYNDGAMIRVYRGIIEGIIVPNHTNINGFGFDPHFKPINQDLTLYELDQIGLKKKYSARAIAIQNMISNSPIFSIPLQEIPEWTGEYQH